MFNRKCKCGQSKKGYLEKWEAREQQAYALEDRDAVLSIYKCPVSEIWHLTSKSQENSY